MGVKDTANLAMIPAAYAEDKVYSVLPSDGDGDFTFTRSGSGTRINKGGYIETMGNNVPRLNYRLDADGNPTECAELLLEASTTNLVRQSENFASTWSKQQSTITSDQVIAPDGTKNGDKLTVTGTSQARCEQIITTVTATSTISCFVKAGNNRYIALAQFGATGTPSVIFDLETGGITTASSYATNKGIQKYPNGWYRIFMTYSHSSGDTYDIVKVVLCNNPTTYFSSTIGDFAYLWGFQKEHNSDPTSYIKTEASTITRNVDSAYNQPFGDLTSDYPITLYWKGRITAYDSGGFNTQSFAGIAKNNDAVRYLNLKFYSTTQLQLERRNTTQRQNFITYTTQLDDVKKIAIKYISSTHVVIFIDGIEVFNNSSLDAVSWDFDSILIGQFRYNTDTGKRIPADELFVWNKALTDAEMVDVTSYDTFAEMATGQQYTIQ